ncbi:hypothetical protein EG329_006851 [Mollisiaceae sp. DMI_Dod_QoI]|nr:hypothetical protein EG329_006851 [Helotiales sp. DMI_Dod_QoI]
MAGRVDEFATLFNDRMRDVLWLHLKGTCTKGNVGETGRALYDEVQRDEELSRRVVFQGVDYNEGKFGAFDVVLGGNSEATLLACKYVDKWTNSAEDRVVVFSGHSQGAQIVRKACDRLHGFNLLQRVAAIYLMGDPSRYGSLRFGLWDQRWKFIKTAGDFIGLSPLMFWTDAHKGYNGVMQDVMESVRHRLSVYWMELFQGDFTVKFMKEPVRKVAKVVKNGLRMMRAEVNGTFGKLEWIRNRRWSFYGV